MSLNTTKPLLGRSAEARWHERNREQVDRLRVVASQDIVPSYGASGVALHLVKNRAGGGGASLTKLILADAGAADYLICRTWDRYYWQAHRDLRTELGTAPTEGELLTRINTLRAAASLAAWTSQQLTDYLAAETLVAKAPELRADAFDGHDIDIEVESWDGVTLSATTRKIRFAYRSATLRTVYDITTWDGISDIEDERKENQSIIPRYTPEFSIIYAVSASEPVMVQGEETTLGLMEITMREWMRT